MKLDATELLNEANSLKEMWVFGYGSLMWNPGFEYADSEVGYIEGYTRKFWQGNTTHRGTPDKPGRVATLIEDKESKVWGRVFHVIGADQILPCLEHVGLRECTLGGYDVNFLPFHPARTRHRKDGVNGELAKQINGISLRKDRVVGEHVEQVFAEKTDVVEQVFAEKTDGDQTNSVADREDRAFWDSADRKERPVLALTFIATRRNVWYLGAAADAATMAAEIVGRRGVCGSNVEYVLRIADFMRREAEHEMEMELRQLEEEILLLLKAKKSSYDDQQWEESELDVCGVMLDDVFRAVKTERIVRGQVPFQNRAGSSPMRVCYKVDVDAGQSDDLDSAASTVEPSFATSKDAAGGDYVGEVSGEEKEKREVECVRRKTSEG